MQVEKRSWIMKEIWNLFLIGKSLKQYLYVFKEKKIMNSEENYGNFTLINETFDNSDNTLQSIFPVIMYLNNRTIFFSD